MHRHAGWDYGHPGYKDALRLLADMRTADGSQLLVRNLALTNFDTARCRELVSNGIPIVSNQVQFSLLDRRPLNAMIPFFIEEAQRGGGGDIKILAYGVLAGGYLTDRWLGQPPPRARPDTASLGKYLGTVQQAGGWGHLQKLLGACRRVADKHGVTIANVATRWVLDQPAVAAAIVSGRVQERSCALPESVCPTTTIGHLDTMAKQAIHSFPCIMGPCHVWLSLWNGALASRGRESSRRSPLARVHVCAAYMCASVRLVRG